MVDISKVKEFYLADYNEMLFPMETCRYLVENAPTLISEFINNIQDPQKSEYCFLPQQTVSASKAKHHVRRTKKLDPVAEYYLYEMAYKNRTVFRKSTNPTRQNFGYRFADGQHVKIHDSYHEFTEQKEALTKQYKYFISFDVSAYFNSIYHHDLTNWFSGLNVEESEKQLFGRFMREINAGFSIDFMPHGVYPAKMIGSHFLSYIDHSSFIQSEHMIRFMDDFVLFSDSKDTLRKDFEYIQELLGQKSLYINSNKSVLFSEHKESIETEVDKIKNGIMGQVAVSLGSGMGYEVYDDIVRQFSTEEIEKLVNLTNRDEVTDKEASLVLDCISQHIPDFYLYIPKFIYRFPHLVKKIFHKCSEITQYEELSIELEKLLDSNCFLNEFQLFWITAITEEYLLDTTGAGKILAKLYCHKNGTDISKARVLEIPEQRFGLPQQREAHLKNGTSGWLAWASAVGMRKDSKQNRTYLLGYFSKASPINKLIADCMNSV
ncbi:TPA: hypothetical protein N3C02_004488 [Vibrio parahaemolyticus]|nr:hypothetical protein [Vibrio fluvialis]HAS6726887.1 hypothetical protein [Vibrio parahaemolyticus]HAS6785154.1 hypothetical protein [Vibrio parahaemolyticus]HAS6793888.1 hypothetical protein [Vibrio parahaemolyticus]HAS6897959.1 hypothetical protein [Vibrio parahaemolyticus]